MKKYLLLPLSVMCLFLGLNNAYAQPTVLTTPDTNNFPTICGIGDQTCLEYHVLDFTDLTKMEFNVLFNEDRVSYSSINILSPLANLSLASFDLTNVANGIIGFTWTSPDPQVGETLEDAPNAEGILFEICFQAEAQLGASEIIIEEGIVNRDISNNFDIGYEFVANSWIQICLPPLIIDVPTVAGLQGETVCQNFEVNNFNEALAVQFSINYDASALTPITATGVEPVTGGSFDFAFPSDGIITVSWSDNDGANGVSLADGTSFIQVCFELIGDCTSFNPVLISDNPTIREVVCVQSVGIGGNQPDKGILTNDGGVIIDCVQPGAPSICIPDVEDICPGESFSICLTTQDFTNLRTMNFSINWNESVLQLDNFTVPAGVLPFFNATNFSGTGTNGTKSCEWTGGTTGSTLPNGTELVCLDFTVVGGSSSNSTVSITSDPTEIFFSTGVGNNAEHIGYNSCNGFVQVCTPTGITVSASNSEVNPGEQTCVDVTVQDFSNITALSFSMFWETSVVNFASVTNFNLPGLSEANFNLGNTNFGTLCLEDWTSPTGISLQDGATIFSLCYEGENNPFACSGISFDNLPCEETVLQEGVNFDIGMNNNQGEICILNPASFITSISNNGGALANIVCVDVSVENFQNLVNMEYSINWNPNLIDFLYIEDTDALINFGENSYSNVNQDNGILGINWESVQQNNGVTLTDGTVIYSICFQILEGLTNCADISISSFPQPINIQNANSPMNIGLEQNTGEICLVEALGITSVITPISCPTEGSCDGSIDVTLTGGNGTYVYEWTGPGIVNSTAEDQTGLCEGTYVLQSLDTSTGLFREDIFTVEISVDAPVADAGEDMDSPCDTNLFDLDLSGSATSMGNNYTYEWQNVSGSIQSSPITVNMLSPTLFGNGEIMLTVTDNNTECVVSDVVNITSPPIPGAVAGPDMTFGCDAEGGVGVTLDGTNSNVSDTYSIDWLALNGGQIQGGTGTSYTPIALTPGTYIIQITDMANGCQATDTTIVTDIRSAVFAEAGIGGILDCGNNEIVLDGTGSDFGGEFSYEWTSPTGAPIGTTLFTSTSEAGMHYFTVSNTTNNCEAIDSVFIDSDMGIPTGSGGPNMPYYCNTTTVTLQGEAPTDGGNYTFQWTGGPMGVTITDATTLNPTVDMPGTYTLTTTNQDTNCPAEFSVLVEDLTQIPIVDAGIGAEINCVITTIQLDGTGSEAGMNYAWTNNIGTTVGIVDETSLTPTISLADTYTLTVTNPISSCTANAQVVVTQGPMLPIAEIAPTDLMIDCTNDEIILDAGNSSVGVDYEYTWTGACIDDLTNPLMPVISCGGTYTLIITDTLLNCATTTMIMIAEDQMSPEIIISPEEPIIACGETNITLDATQSSMSDDITITWSVLAGSTGTITGENTYEPVVTEGSYGVTLLNTLTTCQSTTVVNVVANTVVADAGMDVEMDCAGTPVQLDGSLSTEDADYAWTNMADGTTEGITNETSSTPTVSIAGTYTLTVTDATGACIATDEVTVTQVAPPSASAGEDVGISCADDFVNLDGTASEAGVGISYEWSTNDGTFESTDLTQATVNVNSIGEYYITVSNGEGCASIDTVNVFPQNDNLSTATAVIDYEECAITGILTGNLPEGSTGLWTAVSTANILEASSGTTNVENIPGGETTFTWTLSTEGCPNYSQAMVAVTGNYSPTTTNDAEVMPTGELSISLNVLENDQLGNLPSYTFEVLGEPTIGTITDNPGDGNITFTQIAGTSGVASFEYAICNTVCPSLCDTSSVNITLDGEFNMDNLPNAISPNGDGDNETLIFDILSTGDYPENSIVIFNRWGDEVFSSSPYNNDWDGTFNGQPLPQATYYFVLRLDLGAGEVIKGDVTVLK